MFDVGWSEILLILIVIVLVIGPQDMPKAMRTLGKIARRLGYMRFALTQQFDDFMKQHDLDDLRRGVNFEARDHDPEADADADYAMTALPPAEPDKKDE